MTNQGENRFMIGEKANEAMNEALRFWEHERDNHLHDLNVLIAMRAHGQLCVAHSHVCILKQREAWDFIDACKDIIKTHVNSTVAAMSTAIKLGCPERLEDMHSATEVFQSTMKQ